MDAILNVKRLPSMTEVGLSMRRPLLLLQITVKTNGYRCS